MSKVFISWSGPVAKLFAERFSVWLSDVIQGVQCFFSPEDIAMGTSWVSTISSKLNEHSIGIICLTPENVGAPWIQFEAGALYKGLPTSRVCPLLIGGLERQHVTGPLTIFQMAMPTKEDVFKLVKEVNAQCDPRLDDQRLQRVFEVNWPAFEDGLSKLPPSRAGNAIPVRSSDDILAEVLGTVRAIQNTLTVPARSEEIRGYAEHMHQMARFGVSPGQRFSAHTMSRKRAIPDADVDVSTFAGEGVIEGVVVVDVKVRCEAFFARVMFESPTPFQPNVAIGITEMPQGTDEHSLRFVAEQVDETGFVLYVRTTNPRGLMRGRYAFTFSG